MIWRCQDLTQRKKQALFCIFQALLRVHHSSQENLFGSKAFQNIYGKYKVYVRWTAKKFSIHLLLVLNTQLNTYVSFGNDISQNDDDDINPVSVSGALLFFLLFCCLEYMCRFDVTIVIQRHYSKNMFRCTILCTQGGTKQGEIVDTTVTSLLIYFLYMH